MLGLMNSCAAISLSAAPAAARSATRVSWGVRSAAVCGVRARSPVARSSAAACPANRSAPLLPNGLELLFCAHHNRRHSSALMKIAVDIDDETDRLARPAA